jgi:hypothetical protein
VVSADNEGVVAAGVAAGSRKSKTWHPTRLREDLPSRVAEAQDSAAMQAAETDAAKCHQILSAEIRTR